MATLYNQPKDDDHPYNYHQEQKEEEQQATNNELLIPLLKPVGFLIKLLAYQAEFISSILLYFLSPFLSSSIHLAEEARISADDTINAVPSGGALFLKKLGVGLVGATYAGVFLVALLLFSVVTGVGFVRVWVDEPVYMTEDLYFDFTQVHPTAEFSFLGRRKWIPVDHTFYVSLVLVMPDSDFNRQIGVFQVSAEVISTTGQITAKSSQPCMLRFRSFPIKMMHQFIMGIPLLLGISDETQIITVPLVKHKEGEPRTERIRAKLIPRAGTSAMPQLYAVKIVMKSHLPWRKQMVHDWKWTFYMWTSFYLYVIFLMLLVCCCRPVLFPRTMPLALAVPSRRGREIVGDSETRADREAYESVRNWQPSKSRTKRKAMFLREDFAETVGSTSSVGGGRDERSEINEDWGGFTDGESVCQGG